MKLSNFKEIYVVLKNNMIDFCLNNPLATKFKTEKIYNSLTIVDISKIEEFFPISKIEKEKVFINTGIKKADEIFKLFLDTMNMNFDEDTLSNLYNNIIWVLYEERYFLLYSGEYDTLNNIIRASNVSDRDTITHELLHLASNPYDGKNIHSGFQQKIDKYFIGYGIDEGYTEYLNNRYFKAETIKAYDDQIAICKRLEDIVDQKRMEKMYLKGSLYDLIKYLKQFYSTQEIERFIAAVDFTHDYTNKYFLSDVESEALYSQFETIIAFLFKGFCYKFKNSSITDDNIKEYTYNYIKPLINELDFEIDEFLIEEFELIIEDVLNKFVKLDINNFKDKEIVL